MFGATNIVKNTDKNKYVYKGYGTAFDGAGFLCFVNDFAWIIVFFVVNNSSSSHADNCKNNVLVLGERPAAFNGNVCAAVKKFNSNFSKAKTKFCLILNYNGDNSYLFVNGKEIYKFKADSKYFLKIFPTQFCLGGISNKFDIVECREVSFKGIVYNFSVDYNAIDNSDISNIHKYLIVKNDIK